MLTEPKRLVLRRSAGEKNVLPMERAPGASVLTEPETTGVICVLSEHSLERESLVAALRPLKQGEDVAGFTDAGRLIAELGEGRHPRLILLCLHGAPLSEEGLRSALEDVTARIGTVPVILVTEMIDGSMVARAYELGARGIIPPTVSLAAAAKAMDIVEAGGTYLPLDSFSTMQRIASAAAQKQQPQQPGPSLEGLTDRQHAVLQALRRGKTNKAIAIDLRMQESTVKVHVRNIMKKLNARNRTELAYLVNTHLPESTGGAQP